jgi:MFS family permease
MLFMLNGISYLLSAFSEMFIKLPKQNGAPERSWRQSYTEFIALLKEGFRYSWYNPQLRYLLLIIGIYHFFVAPLPILLPFWVSDTLGLSEQWLGFLFAGFAFGILVGFAIAGFFDLTTGNVSRLVAILFLLSAFLFGMFGLFPVFIVSLLSLVLLGIIVGIVVVIHITFMQRTTPEQMHGRVFGFLNTITNASTPIGMAVYGLLLEVLNKTVSPAVSPTQLIFVCNGILVFIIMTVIIKRVDLGKIFRTNLESLK